MPNDPKTFETSDELEQAGSVEVAAEPQKTFAQVDQLWETVTRHWNSDRATPAQNG